MSFRVFTLDADHLDSTAANVCDVGADHGELAVINKCISKRTKLG
jgi:hypothetical protein